MSIAIPQGKVMAERMRRVPKNTRNLPAETAKSAGLCMFQPVIEPIVRPASPHLVITLGTSKARELLRLSATRMQAYAQRVGADFIQITNATQTWPLAEKFRVQHYAKHYERILFLDADVFVRESAPDIFELVPPGAIAVHDDTPDTKTQPKGDGWLMAEQRQLAESQGVPHWTGGCLNTGIVVFDGTDADIWAPPEKIFPVRHCMEQHWVQRAIVAKARTFFLSPEWNWQFWIHPTMEGVEHAHFVHLSGLSNLHPAMLLPMMRALSIS